MYGRHQERRLGEHGVQEHPMRRWLGEINVLEEPSRRWLGENNILEEPRRRWLGENNVLEKPRRRWPGDNPERRAQQAAERGPYKSLSYTVFTVFQSSEHSRNSSPVLRAR